jgi:hypothetical protein
LIALFARDTSGASSRGFLVVKRPRKKTPSVSAAADAADADPAEILRNLLPFVMSEELDKVRSYVARGRRFAQADSVTLKDAWVETLGKLPPDPIDPDLRLALDDIGAELQLRGEEPPAERAQAALDAFVRSVDALVADAIKTDPEAWDRHNAELTRDIQQFIQQKRRGN